MFTAHGQPLTRYGIYKIIRRHAARFDDPRTGRQVSPHTFRHTAAVHLLEAGVEVNVIRGFRPAVGEVTDQLLLFRVHRDDRVARPTGTPAPAR